MVSDVEEKQGIMGTPKTVALDKDNNEQNDSSMPRAILPVQWTLFDDVPSAYQAVGLLALET
ncbi:hypothetical protein H9L39_15788 [Fusarium oxysporum f. sp. albedinis]|nr:hypothetical protein H9L39_15788 [Fusarium oxysporum f. sp. albedinis]